MTVSHEQDIEDDFNLWSVVVEGTERDDRGPIRRCFDPLSSPTLGLDGVQTLYEAFRRGASLNPLGPCLGFRAMSTSGFPTPYIYSSYTECLARINAFAAGLDELDLLQDNEDGMRVIALYMKNCMEWTIAEHATYAVGGVTAPLYDTLGPDTVRFILQQTGAKSVVCTRAELPALCEAKKSGDCPTFSCAILVDGVIPEAAQMAEAASLQVHSFAKVEAAGAQHIATKRGGHQHRPPSPKDVATFCYTSGTTGNPKGALLSHQNFCSMMAGMAPFFQPEAYDRHLSYLPLAHIFERVVVSQVVASGASIAFFRGNPLWLIEDLQAARPTSLPVAPRVLNKIYDKIMSGMSAAGGIKKKLFDAALAAKTRGLQQGHLKHALYDRLIFNKIKAALGLDCIRFMVSGSAPLSEPVMVFFRVLLGVPVVEGYGQTEGTAGATISHPDDISTVGHVGGPTGACEICLMDVAEMGYLHTDTMHRGSVPCQGRGEICVRGPNVFLGYYKDPEKTRETIDSEGWLHSGDIGLWTMQGQLQIIDRKKNIFKLSIGEYVAPEKIENILSQSLLIAQCFVYGDSFQNCLVAIVVPDEEPVMHRYGGSSSTTTNHPPSSFEQLCQSSAELKNDLMAEIVQRSKDNGLHGFETVKDIFIECKPFTQVTPTFKLKRNQLRDYYQAQIDAMYANLLSSKQQNVTSKL